MKVIINFNIIQWLDIVVCYHIFKVGGKCSQYGIHYDLKVSCFLRFPQFPHRNTWTWCFGKNNSWNRIYWRYIEGITSESRNWTGFSVGCKMVDELGNLRNIKNLLWKSDVSKLLESIEKWNFNNCYIR